MRCYALCTYEIVAKNTKLYNLYELLLPPAQYELLMHSSATTVPNCQSLKPTKKLFISESFETRPGWLTLPLE